MRRNGVRAGAGFLPDFTAEPGDVMKKCRVIAVVGASRNSEKEASEVPAYLQGHGYEIIPVNPNADSIAGLRAYPTLADIPGKLAARVDIVDVFRPSKELIHVARQAAEMKKKTGRPFVFWAQLGLESEEAKLILRRAAIDYVMDRCMKIEHFRLTMKRTNEAWHRSHPSPAIGTRSEKLVWQAAHATECGCTSVPPRGEAGVEAVRAEVRSPNLMLGGRVARSGE